MARVGGAAGILSGSERRTYALPPSGAMQRVDFRGQGGNRQAEPIPTRAHFSIDPMGNAGIVFFSLSDRKDPMNRNRIGRKER